LEWSQQNQNQINHFINWGEMEQARAAVAQVEQEISTLSQLLPVSKGTESIPRKKRGLINLGGETLKFLFGVATTQQLQDLHTTVEGIKNKEGDVIHAVQQQLTYLKSVDEEVSQNAVGLARMARILKGIITNALNRQKILNDTFRNLEQLVEYQSNVSRTMRELEFMVIQLQQSVLRLQEGLDISATGRLSSVLIPPHNLSKFLQEVVLKLPPDVSLIAGCAIENMYVYYEIAKVQAYATTTAIRLVVRLPLRGADRVMTLFKSILLLV
jgi:hypothetical protein